MRRILPVLVVLAVLAAGWLAWQRHWFGLGATASTIDPGADLAPSEAGGPEALAARAALAGGADPRTFEGEPVGRRDLGLGGASVAGRVEGPDGPLRFARVLPVLAPPEEGHGVRTTKEGTFEILGLPAGPDADLRVSAEGFVSRTVRTPALVEGVRADLGAIRLSPRAPSTDGLEVKVLDPTGRPVTGTKVSATTMPFGLFVTLGASAAGIPEVITREAVTDDLGVARLQPIPPEKYDVIVRSPGHVLEAIENVVVASGRVEHLTISLRPALTIQGTVVDADGAPVTDAYVTGLGQPNFRQYEAVPTGAGGAFVLGGLVPGSYWLFAGSDEKGEGQATGVKAGDKGVRIELKGVGRLEGRVVATDGTPVPRFVLRPYSAQPFRYVYSSLHEFSDPDGRFSLPLAPGTYQLDAKAAGAGFVSVPSVTVEAGGTREVTITLPAEGVVKGVVTDPEGQHLAGAEVYVKRGGFPPTPVREQYVRTDADGAFLLSGLPFEAQKLHVRHPAYAVAVIDTTPTSPAQAKELTVRLAAGARVVGRIATSEGTAVPGEQVTLFQGVAFFDARSAVTDGEGRYEFRALAAGDYAVATGRFEASAAGQRKTAKVPAEGVVTVDFVVEGDREATSVVTGRVTVGGAPAAEATVTAVDERGWEAAVTTKTDADGRYVARGLKAGRVTIAATTVSGLQDSDAVRIGEPGQTVTLDIAFGTAGLRALVVGSDGRTTVSGAWVQVETAERAEGQQAWQTVRAVVQTDNAGLLVAQGIEPGNYRLRISGSGYAAKLTDPFALGEGETRDLGAVRLEAGGGVSGRVTDETGAPVEGIGVSLRNAKGEDVFLYNLVSTGSNGRYEVQALELGRYRVRFEGKGYAPAEQTVDVTAQGAIADGVVSRGGALLVRVEDESGQALPGARVVLYDASGAEVRRTLSIVSGFEDVARVNASGQARIPDLAPGTYRATARRDGLLPAAEPTSVVVTAGGETPVTVVLKAGG